jgi:hypothetical protein
MISFYPFKNECDALTLGDLKLENHEDRIAVYGSLQITRDRAGLNAAKALQEVLGRIIKELEDEHDLPLTVASAEPAMKVKNPFGVA